MEDEVELVEIGGREVLMKSDEWAGYCRDREEYGVATVDVDERGVGTWVPQRDLACEGDEATVQ